jgi:hypothetical protein
MNIKNLSHYGDILAIPFFALLVIYFYNITNKSIIEYVLLLFSISGFIFDILFSYLFLSRVKISYNYIYLIILCILIFGFISIKEGNTTTQRPTTTLVTTTQIPNTTLVTTTQGPVITTTTPLPTNPPPPTLETTDPMLIKEGIEFPYNSIKTINYILNDNVLTNQKKVNMVKQFGISSSTETIFYNILFNTLYTDGQKVSALLDYIESKYRIRECQITSTSPPL